jgi:hypothetical protein
MLFLQTPPLLCIVIGSTSLFPAMIAVACLLPSKRTIALRLIGAVVCIACVGTLIMSFVTPPGNEQQKQRDTALLWGGFIYRALSFDWFSKYMEIQARI